MSEKLPEDTADEAERLTRLAREVIDESEAEAYRTERAELLAEHGYTSRVREDGTRDVLVLHPEEWVEDGKIRVERIEDVDRGIERPLSGPGPGDDWEEIEGHNRAVAERIEREHGEVHGANAHAFADFMSNHYAKPVEMATRGEREEFKTEYFPRNAWPSEKQRALLDESLTLVEKIAEDA